MTNAHAGTDLYVRALPDVVTWSAAAVCVLAWAALLLTGTVLPLAAIAGACLTLAFVARPDVAAVAFLISTVTVLDPAQRVIPAGPIMLSVADACLVAGLAAVVVRRLIGTQRHSQVLFAWPMSAYLFAASAALMVGIRFGDAPDQAIAGFRAIITLSGYWILRDAFDGRPWAVARALVGVAVVGSAVALLGAYLGWDVGGPKIDYVITGGQITETTRLASPVLRLLSIAIPLAILAPIFARRPVTRWILVLAPMIAAEAASLTRSTWVPLALVCVALPAAVAQGNRALALIARGAALVLLVVAALGIATLFGVAGSASAIVDRVASTVDSETVSDDSLSDRLLEVRAASSALIANATMGIGLQQDYGVVNTTYDPETDTDAEEPRRWIHNSVLGVWLWMGMLGVGAFLWLAFRIGSTGMAAYRESTRRRGARTSREDGFGGSRERDARAALGAAGGLAVLLAQSTFQTNLAYAPALAALAAGLAYLDAWASTRRVAGCHADAVTESLPELTRSTVHSQGTAPNANGELTA